MFALPAINGIVPSTIRTGTLSAPIARLGQTMINADMIEASDLRTGAAGAARMIERAWERWQAEDDLPAVPELPVSFYLSDPHMPWLENTLKRSAPDVTWLVLANSGNPARWYVGYVDGLIAKGRADLAEHALATLYGGLDAICYAPKPTEFLAWAEAFWWKGHENEKDAGIKKPKATGVQGMIRHDIPTRRRFDHRYPPILISPRRQPASMTRIPRDWRTLAEAIEAVDHAMKNRYLLRPNLPSLTAAPVTRFAAFVRYAHGDYLQRLVDTYFHHASNHKNRVPFHGAWPLRTADDIIRARRGIAANTHLAHALATLCNQIGGIAKQSMGGHW